MGTYVLGIDAGTESIRTGVFDTSGRCVGFGVTPINTFFQHPGWAEQSPREWDSALIESVRRAMANCRIRASEIVGIGIDGTSCTVVFFDADMVPLRNADNVDGYPCQ